MLFPACCSGHALFAGLWLFQLLLVTGFVHGPLPGARRSPCCGNNARPPEQSKAVGLFDSKGSCGASRRSAAAAEGESKEWALIFDCDGVILESESLHREAYNTVFKEFDVAYNWSPEYYDELQNKVGGGKPKMRYYFGENGWPSSKLGPAPDSEEAQATLVDELQDRKTEIYKDFVRNGVATLRPGIKRVIDEALSLSPTPKLAICSASTKDACLFVLDNLLGQTELDKFELILAGDDVPERKPHPMIYSLAAEKLGLSPQRCMVVEDSVIGLQAAMGAGMKCVITTTSSTEAQDFTGSAGVFSELGEGGGVQVTASALLDLLHA